MERTREALHDLDVLAPRSLSTLPTWTASQLNFTSSAVKGIAVVERQALAPA